MYWKDIIDHNGNWIKLRTVTSDNQNSGFWLESGNNCRFKLYNQSVPLIWGTIGSEYWGVWILQNKYDWSLEEMPVKPINSHSIESSKNSNYLQFWSRFFASELNKSSFISNGIWTINEGSADHTNYKVNSAEFVNFQSKEVLDLNPKWFEWGNHVITLKNSPEADSSRVKWFRKLVLEDVCPPLLVWYVACLGGYVLLDGHSRYRAYQLENKIPKVVVLNSVKEENLQRTVHYQTKIQKSIEQRQNHPFKPKLSIDRVNSLLIDAFNNSVYHTPFNSAKAKQHFDGVWTKEVQKEFETLGLDMELLQYMLERFGLN